MTWVFTTTSTAPIVATTSTTPSQSFLAPTRKQASKKRDSFIFLAVFLPPVLIAIYWMRMQRLKRRRVLRRVTPMTPRIFSKPLKLWDATPKSPFPNKGFSFKSNFSRASIATSPDYKKNFPVDDMDSSMRSTDLAEVSKSLPYLLGSLKSAPGDKTNRNLNSWQSAHNKHFPGVQMMQKNTESGTDIKHVAAQNPQELDAEKPLRQVAQQSSASPSMPEVTLQDLELRHAARQTCMPSTPEVTGSTAKAPLAATSAVKAPPPLPTNIRPPPVWE